MADLTGGDFNKFTVLKNEDLEKYLSPLQKEDFAHLLREFELRRKMRRQPSKTYLVVNTDEPYADEIIDILKRNGHWG